MPIGLMVGTSQIKSNSFALSLFLVCGLISVPNHCITLNLMCLWEWECLDTGVSILFVFLEMCSYILRLNGRTVPHNLHSIRSIMLLISHVMSTGFGRLVHVWVAPVWWLVNVFILCSSGIKCIYLIWCKLLVCQF